MADLNQNDLVFVIDTTDDSLKVVTAGTISTIAYVDSADLTLSNLTNDLTARSNLGVAIGSDVQAYSSNLTSFLGNYTFPTDTGTVGQILKIATGGGALEWQDDTSGGGGGSQNLFSTIAVSGQTSIVADALTDTLTIVAGTNISLTTNATTDTLTIGTTGLGSLATLSSVNNSNWSGTDLSIANGGTGASDAQGARSNLELGTSDSVTFGALTASSATVNGVVTAQRNTASRSQPQLHVKNDNAGGSADATIRFETQNGTIWTAGIDNSSSDFHITNDDKLGNTSHDLRIDNDGRVLVKEDTDYTTIVDANNVLTNKKYVDDKSFNSDWVSILEYGAVGDSDGTDGNGTDNTTAINNALASGKNVYIPAGGFRHAGMLTCNNPGVHIWGGDKNNARLICDNTTANQPSFRFDGSNGKMNSVRVEGVRFDSTPRRKAIALSLQQSALEFYNPDSSNGATQSSFIKSEVEHCQFTDAPGPAIGIINALFSSSQINLCHFVDIGMQGIISINGSMIGYTQAANSPSELVSVSDCRWSECGGEAIHVPAGGTLRWIINNGETSRVANNVDARIEDAGYYFEDATTVTFNNTAANVPEINNSDGAISSGSNSFTSALGNFPTSIVGKYVVIEGAGASGAGLSALITARPNSTTLTLDRTAGTTVSGADYVAQNGYTFKLKNSNAIKFDNIRMVQTAGMFLEGCTGIQIDQCKYFFDDVGTADGQVGHVVDLLNCGSIKYDTGSFGALKLDIDGDGVILPVRVHPSSTSYPTGTVTYNGFTYELRVAANGDPFVALLTQDIQNDATPVLEPASSTADDFVVTGPFHRVRGFANGFDNVNHLWYGVNGQLPPPGFRTTLVNATTGGTLNLTTNGNMDVSSVFVSGQETWATFEFRGPTQGWVRIANGSGL